MPRPDEALMKRVRDVLLKVFNDEYGEGGIVAEAAVSKEMAGSNGSSGAATSASGHCGGGEAQLRRAFEELHERAVRAYEEEQRYARRAEEKFRALLQEYFYLSDQVNLDWELAKKKIQSRSAYDNLPRADRKRLFQEHMDALKQKYKAKEKALTALNGSDEVPHVLVLSESKAVGAEVEICKSTALSGTKDGDNVKGSAVVASSSSGSSSTRQPHTRSKVLLFKFEKKRIFSRRCSYNFKASFALLFESYPLVCSESGRTSALLSAASDGEVSDD